MGGLKVLMFMCLLEGVDYWGTIGLYRGGAYMELTEKFSHEEVQCASAKMAGHIEKGV